jgi:hypothetical protein
MIDCCSTHLRYKAMLPPRVACFECWVYWLSKHATDKVAYKRIRRQMESKGMRWG